MALYKQFVVEIQPIILQGREGFPFSHDVIISWSKSYIRHLWPNHSYWLHFANLMPLAIA
jgi:hypothetical protein